MSDYYQKCLYRVSVKALILNDKKEFLLIKEREGKLWELPGGGLEYGESIRECLERELKEELGVEVEFVSLSPSYFFTLKGVDNQMKAMVIYEVETKNMNLKLEESFETYKFFNLKEAKEVDVFPSVIAFLNLYNPNNHK